VVEPYRALHDDYARAFAAARPMLPAQLAAAAGRTMRAHFAGDPRATPDQAMTRWALPTLARAWVVDGVDAVFVEHAGGWRAIVGTAAIVRRRVAALDATCAAALDRIDPAGGRCIETAWAVADAALRGDRARFAHACSLATAACR
jgi:hypothetical protein